MRDFCELDPLAVLDIEELTLEDNPVCAVPLLRDYMIVRLPSLTRFCGKDVDSDEADAAGAIFGRMTRHWGNRSLVPNMTARERLSSGSRSLVRKEARAYASSLVADACEGDRKSRLLWSVWDDVVGEIVSEALQ